VAAGAISDISACDGVPLFYGHSMVVSKAWDDVYIKKFSQGVADVLKETETAFIGGDLGKRVSIEAGVSMGWGQWIGPSGISISIDTFGESAPMSDLQGEFGFNVDAILNRILT